MDYYWERTASKDEVPSSHRVQTHDLLMYLPEHHIHTSLYLTRALKITLDNSEANLRKSSL